MISIQKHSIISDDLQRIHSTHYERCDELVDSCIPRTETNFKWKTKFIRINQNRSIISLTNEWNIFVWYSHLFYVDEWWILSKVYINKSSELRIVIMMIVLVSVSVHIFLIILFSSVYDL